jgi:hypothetical protein
MHPFSGIAIEFIAVTEGDNLRIMDMCHYHHIIAIIQICLCVLSIAVSSFLSVSIRAHMPAGSGTECAEPHADIRVNQLVEFLIDSAS